MNQATRPLRILVLVLFLLATPGMACRATHPELQGLDQRLPRFEKQADELRQLLKIPGMSAVIIKDQKVLVANGEKLTAKKIK